MTPLSWFNRTSSLLFIILAICFTTEAQEYSFPTFDILKENGVKKVRLYIHELEAVKGWHDSLPVKHIDNEISSRLIQTYVLNDSGLIDSVIYSVHPDRFVGATMKYDSENRLIHVKESLLKRPQFQDITLTETAYGWKLTTYEDGKLIRSATIRSDSLLLTDTAYRGAQINYYHFYPDEEREVSQTTFDGKLSYASEHRWVVRDGVPDSLYMVNEFFDKKVPRHIDFKKNTRYAGAHKVHESGAVLHSSDSDFNDHLEGIHFETRLNKYWGIPLYVAKAFREAKMIDRSPIISNMSFDGNTYGHYYRIEYVK